MCINIKLKNDIKRLVDQIFPGFPSSYCGSKFCRVDLESELRMGPEYAELEQNSQLREILALHAGGEDGPPHWLCCLGSSLFLLWAQLCCVLSLGSPFSNSSSKISHQVELHLKSSQ